MTAPPWRSRIIGHARVRAGYLVPQPLNPRTHPDFQASALRAALNRLGFARSLLAHRCPMTACARPSIPRPSSMSRSSISPRLRPASCCSVSIPWPASHSQMPTAPRRSTASSHPSHRCSLPCSRPSAKRKTVSAPCSIPYTQRIQKLKAWQLMAFGQPPIGLGGWPKLLTKSEAGRSVGDDAPRFGRLQQQEGVR